MKKTLQVIFATALTFSLTVSPAIQETEAATKVKVYKNCTELNKVYKGGVAKDKTVKNKGGKTRYAPHVSAALYKANSTKDRDKDGIACER